MSKSLITTRNKSPNRGEFETNMKKNGCFGKNSEKGLPDSKSEVKLNVIIGFWKIPILLFSTASFLQGQRLEVSKNTCNRHFFPILGLCRNGKCYKETSLNFQHSLES